MRKTATAAIAAIVAGLALAGLSPASHAAAGATQPHELHRVVWDANNATAPLIEVLSSRPDGSDRRVIFRRARGFVLDLDLNPRGTEVAMAPFEPHESPSELLVVNALNGERRDLLNGLRRFAVLGGIGWSPDGRRLAFEGWVDQHGKRLGYMWTIRRDGTGLTRRILLPRSGDQWVSSDHLVWTRRGIYYTGAQGLMRLRRHPRRVLTRASDPIASGNGAWIYVRRTSADGQTTRMWRMRQSGSQLQRTRYRLGSSPDGYALPIVPSPSGRRMLSWLDGEDGNAVVLHDATRGPHGTDRQLGFLHESRVVDWN